jgi:hypothetical protein
MIPPAIQTPQLVLNLKLGNSVGQLEEELDVLFRHEYFHYPENVRMFSIQIFGRSPKPSNSSLFNVGPSRGKTTNRGNSPPRCSGLSEMQNTSATS